MFVTVYILVVAGVLGLVVGSFVNCWAWRYVNGESVMRGRSHCTACGHALGVRDLVPVFSWLFSKGRCRYCGNKVSARYPLTELVCAAAFVCIVLVYGLTVEAAELLLFASILLFLSLTDIDDFIIPNGCIIAALVVRAAYLAFCWVRGNMADATVLFYVASGLGMGLVMLVFTLIADRVFKRPSMGGGDLKLFAVAGFYFGWQQGIYLVLLSCVIGIATQLVRSRSRKGGDKAEADDLQDDDAPAEGDGASPDDARGRGRQRSSARPSKPFPFGPSIAAACVITMLIGGPFVTWYLNLL